MTEKEKLKALGMTPKRYIFFSEAANKGLFVKSINGRETITTPKLHSAKVLYGWDDAERMEWRLKRLPENEVMKWTMIGLLEWKQKQKEKETEATA